MDNRKYKCRCQLVTRFICRACLGFSSLLCLVWLRGLGFWRHEHRAWQQQPSTEQAAQQVWIRRSQDGLVGPQTNGAQLPTAVHRKAEFVQGGISFDAADLALLSVETKADARSATSHKNGGGKNACGTALSKGEK